ncbi:MAG: hypothetical protein ABJI22_18800 [Maribacter sp.]
MSTYYEDCFGLTSRYLRQSGFFKNGAITFSDLSFKSNNENYNVRILTTLIEKPTLICQFLYDGKIKRVEINLLARYNHLGGVGYKFECPMTGKGCYKLYFINGVIGSRGHFKLLNKSQIKSQRIKKLDKEYSLIFKAEKAEQEISSHGFRKYHKGNMTKKYKRCLDAIENAKGLKLNNVYDSLVKV